jgi:hypothetical protein
MNYRYYEADPGLGQQFRAAEEDLCAVAAKHGFSLKLVDDGKGTWFFYPEVDCSGEDH